MVDRAVGTLFSAERLRILRGKPRATQFPERNSPSRQTNWPNDESLGASAELDVIDRAPACHPTIPLGELLGRHLGFTIAPLGTQDAGSTEGDNDESR
jgi:hypothetical protein